MHCPECGEDAVNRPPADLVPWEAHGMTRPEWSHRDGSSLCPVTGPSGGFQPAQPCRGADRESWRVPPATVAFEARDPGDPFGRLYDSIGRLIESQTEPPGSDRHAVAGQAKAGREYLKSAIARLRMTRPQPAVERDREAGA
jgi:hypothetical protein